MRDPLQALLAGPWPPRLAILHPQPAPPLRFEWRHRRTLPFHVDERRRRAGPDWTHHGALLHPAARLDLIGGRGPPALCAHWVHTHPYTWALLRHAGCLLLQPPL